MKYFLFVTILFLSSTKIFCQIASYDDPRIPSELISAIRKLTPETFEDFSKNGTGNIKLRGQTIKVKYSAFYQSDGGSGYIKGSISYSVNGESVSEDVKLPFRYCCDNHNPAHCASTKDEMKKNQDNNGCKGWHRAES